MGNRIFKRVKYSDYLGEERPLLDIYVAFEGTPTPTPTPSNTPTLTPTPTPSATPTSTPTPTPTVVPSIITANLQTYYDGTNSSSLSGSGATRWYSISGGTSSDWTLVNSPTYTTDYGGGLIFDGVDDYAYAPVNLPLGLDDPWTVEFWFEWIFTSSFKRIYAADSNEMNLAHGGNHTVAWYSPSNGWNTPSCLTTGDTCYLLDNTVYHFAAVFSGSQIKFYRNGVNYYTSGASFDIDPTNVWLSADPGSGGDNNTNTYYKIRTYSAALSDADVLNNFNVEKSNYGY